MKVEKCLACGSPSNIVFHRIDCSNKKCRHYSKQLILPDLLKVGMTIRWVEASDPTLAKAFECPASDWSGWELFAKQNKYAEKLSYNPGYKPNSPWGLTDPVIIDIKGTWFSISEFPDMWAPVSAAREIVTPW